MRKDNKARFSLGSLSCSTVFFIPNLSFLFLFLKKHPLNSVSNLRRNISKPRQVKTRAEHHVGFLLHEVCKKAGRRRRRRAGMNTFHRTAAFW